MELIGLLSYITWDINPNLISLGKLTIRWYGLLFMLGFIFGQQILFKIYKWEGKKTDDVERLTIYMVVAVIIGARLGHCLFYDPVFYLSNPWEILQIWKGGLASHGGALGILIGVWIYARKTPGQSYLWVLDRLVIVVALAGSLIRIGNLFNSEILGVHTTVPWAFIFEKVDQAPRHPAQLYEAITTFILFVFLFFYYKKFKIKLPEGRTLGLFMLLLFTMRFFHEFIKVQQAHFHLGIPLNMGQLLSIPLALAGAYILYRSYQPHAKRPRPETSSQN